MRVTFKYVGSGDSIILESISGDESKIGIIDCHKVSGTNPTLGYLKEQNLDKIDFIFLSHPHYDHYSGLLEILDYCESNRISITFFALTVEIDQKILSGLLNGVNENKLLAKIYTKARDLEISGLIEHRSLVSYSSPSVSLDENYKIRFLAPNLLERENYLKTVFNKDLSFKKPDPNIISLVTCVESKDEFIILTSDSTVETLRRIGIKELKDSKYKKDLILGQVPHHGSLNNHNREFWKRLNYEEGTPLAISVGINDSHNPSEQVIDELTELGYSIRSTCDKKLFKTKATFLDDFSEPAENFESVNDLIFEYK